MSIFPYIKELELPYNFEEEVISKGYGIDFEYDFKKGDFVLLDGAPKQVNDKGAIAVWIEKIMRTQKDKWQIYANTNYGVNLEDLIFGKAYPLSFVKAEVKRELTTSILQHNEIRKLDNWDFKLEDEILKVKFTVYLKNEETISKEMIFGETY